MIGDWGNLGNKTACVTFDGGEWSRGGSDKTNAIFTGIGASLFVFQRRLQFYYLVTRFIRHDSEL